MYVKIIAKQNRTWVVHTDTQKKGARERDKGSKREREIKGARERKESKRERERFIPVGSGLPSFHLVTFMELSSLSRALA